MPLISSPLIHSVILFQRKFNQFTSCYYICYREAPAKAGARIIR